MESKTRNKYYGKCRFCFTMGHHKDIMKEYRSNGIHEIYYNMFMECFNLFLSTNSNLSTLMCSSCVQRLKEANTFKTMVMAAEQELLGSTVDKETVFVNVPTEDRSSPDMEAKPMELLDLKAELESSDDDIIAYVVQDNEFEMELDSKLANESEMSEEERLIARFPPGSIKPLPQRIDLYSICPQYIGHLDALRDKVVVPRMITQLVEETERRGANKLKDFVTEKRAHITNVMTLIQNSNITPFKSKNRNGFPCFYCRVIHETLESLITHQNAEHKRADAKRILSIKSAECLVIYVDITNLKCTICNQSVPNLNELKAHLIKHHKKKMYTEYTDRVIPFKLNETAYTCQICGCNFETFGSIERHMNFHFRNYICKECGTGFVTKYRLKIHTKSVHALHTDGEFPCEVCSKPFATQQKLKNHVDAVHKMVKRFKCTKCPERFGEYFRRQKHMVSVHGVPPLQYKCNVCDKSFDRRYTLSRHLKRDHLEERDYQCDICAYKCFTNNELSVHMVKHNGERVFECSVCKKSYARKKTLKEHMRIHNNDRRFACAVCGQAFVQKCSLKGHMKTHHMEYTMQ